MIKQYQITLLSTKGYKAVSTIVKNEEIDLKDKDTRKTIINKGVVKICNQRLWGKRELKDYGYTKPMLREYDKAKIEQENKERYEKIKEQHYQDGTWKRPKENK